MDIKDRVLIVEDDKSIRNFLRTVLEANNFDVITAVTGAEAYSMATSQCPDLVILDLGLPDMDGMKILKGIREWSAMPILVVSARSHERDKVEALDAGADDYITKPFSLSVLRARVNTQLRKQATSVHTALFQMDGFVFDFDQMQFRVNGTAIELSKTEQKLLRLLVENHGKPMSRSVLIDRIWTDGAEYVDENALSVTVKRLRDKLGAHDYIQTVYGIGYIWEKKHG